MNIIWWNLQNWRKAKIGWWNIQNLLCFSLQELFHLLTKKSKQKQSIKFSKLVFLKLSNFFKEKEVKTKYFWRFCGNCHSVIFDIHNFSKFRFQTVVNSILINTPSFTQAVFLITSKLFVFLFLTTQKKLPQRNFTTLYVEYHSFLKF